MYANSTLDKLEVGPREHDYGGTHVVCCLLLVVIVFHIRHHLSMGASIPSALVCCLLGIAVSPLFLLTIPLFAVYRSLVRIVLSKRCPGFSGLIDGPDAFWSLEQDSSRAVVNILAFLELNTNNDVQDMRKVFKSLFEDRLLSDKNLYKFKCVRVSSFGYFYWEQMSDLCLEEHVRWMDLDVVTEDSVVQYVADVSNRPLPREHTTQWEVLVSQHLLERNGRQVCPVLFRVHHALGDGLAMVSLLLGSLADGSSTITPKLGPYTKLLAPPKNVFETHCDSRRRSSLFFTDELTKLNKHCVWSLASILQKVSVILLTPYVILRQNYAAVDKNLLHGAELVGRKNIGWAIGHNTLTQLKYIKNKLNCRFTDIVMLAISNAFEDYFSMYSAVPKHLKLVVTARIPVEYKLGGSNSLSNDGFTASVVELPILSEQKFQDIKDMTNSLRLQPASLANYWVFKVLCTYYPLVPLGNAMQSKRVTMAMSNIPGPSYLVKIGSNTVHDLIFWLPNKDTTGVGVSILSYAGKMNFGITVDAALMPIKEDAAQIAIKMVDEIEKMYKCVKGKYG